MWYGFEIFKSSSPSSHPATQPNIQIKMTSGEFSLLQKPYAVCIMVKSTTAPHEKTILLNSKA